MPAPGRAASEIVTLSDVDMVLVQKLADERLNDTKRHRSAHRPSARNLTSQLRGAAGEVAASRWFSANGLVVEAEGFLEDDGVADLVVAGRGIEVMTARIPDRTKTGFCVPPGKLKAARARGAWGYLFVGVGQESVPRTVTMQAGCTIDLVDSDEMQKTFVTSSAYAVDNYVVRPGHLLTPEAVLIELRQDF